jgi:hypothetical protein
MNRTKAAFSCKWIVFFTLFLISCGKNHEHCQALDKKLAAMDPNVRKEPNLS